MVNQNIEGGWMDRWMDGERERELNYYKRLTQAFKVACLISHPQYFYNGNNHHFLFVCSQFRWMAAAMFKLSPLKIVVSSNLSILKLTFPTNSHVINISIVELTISTVCSTLPPELSQWMATYSSVSHISATFSVHLFQ